MRNTTSLRPRILALVMCACALACLGATLTLGSAAVPAGGVDVTLPITLDHTVQESVAGIQLDLAFPDALMFTDAEIGAVAAGAGKTLQYTDLDNGDIRIVVTGFNLNTIPSGVVASVAVCVTTGAAPAVYAVEVKNPLLSTAFGASISATAESGAITVGNAAFSPADINRDTRLDAMDVQLVINGALGLSVSPYDADVADDGRVDAMDVQVVINAVLGLGA